MFSHFVAVGPYVNAVISGKHLASQLVSEVTKLGVAYGSSKTAVPHKMLIESPSPNTNKPLHLGHVRNMLLGNVLAAVNTFI